MFDPDTNQKILIIIAVILLIFSVFYFIGARSDRPLRHQFKKDNKKKLVLALDIFCGGFLFFLSIYFFGLKYTILLALPFAFILSYICQKLDDWREKRIEQRMNQANG